MHDHTKRMIYTYTFNYISIYIFIMRFKRTYFKVFIQKSNNDNLKNSIVWTIMNQENILYIQILMSLCLLNVQTLKLYACWYPKEWDVMQTICVCFLKYYIHFTATAWAILRCGWVDIILYELSNIKFAIHLFIDILKIISIIS